MRMCARGGERGSRMLDAIHEKLTSAGFWVALGASVGTFVLGIITGLTNDTLRDFLARRREKRDIEKLLPDKDERKLLILAARHDGRVYVSMKDHLEDADPVSIGKAVVKGMSLDTVLSLTKRGYLESRTANKYVLTERGREMGERLIVLYGEKTEEVREPDAE